jgi:hypothetical protein
MIGNARYELTPDDIKLLDISRVIQYLKTRGWRESLTIWRGIIHIFDRPEANRKLEQIRIPVSHNLMDYDDVMLKSLLS